MEWLRIYGDLSYYVPDINYTLINDEDAFDAMEINFSYFSCSKGGKGSWYRGKNSNGYLDGLTHTEEFELFLKTHKTSNRKIGRLYTHIPRTLAKCCEAIANHNLTHESNTPDIHAVTKYGVFKVNSLSVHNEHDSNTRCKCQV